MSHFMSQFASHSISFSAFQARYVRPIMTPIQVTELSLEVMKAPRFRQGSAELVVALGASEDVSLSDLGR